MTVYLTQIHRVFLVAFYWYKNYIIFFRKEIPTTKKHLFMDHLFIIHILNLFSNIKKSANN